MLFLIYPLIPREKSSLLNDWRIHCIHQGNTAIGMNCNHFLQTILCGYKYLCMRPLEFNYHGYETGPFIKGWAPDKLTS